MELVFIDLRRVMMLFPRGQSMASLHFPRDVHGLSVAALDFGADRLEEGPAAKGQLESWTAAYVSCITFATTRAVRLCPTS